MTGFIRPRPAREVCPGDLLYMADAPLWRAFVVSSHHLTREMMGREYQFVVLGLLLYGPPKADSSELLFVLKDMTFEPERTMYPLEDDP